MYLTLKVHLTLINRVVCAVAAILHGAGLEEARSILTVTAKDDQALTKYWLLRWFLGCHSRRLQVVAAETTAKLLRVLEMARPGPRRQQVCLAALSLSPCLAESCPLTVFSLCPCISLLCQPIPGFFSLCPNFPVL